MDKIYIKKKNRYLNSKPQILEFHFSFVRQVDFYGGVKQVIISYVIATRFDTFY